jgi:hypothetical protein
VIAVIPCGKAKRPTPMPAGDLYVGPYFRACRDYALSILPRRAVYVLSAKYGLLTLDDRIAPYELTLGQPGAVTVQRLRNQARSRGLLLQQAILVCGGHYADYCAQVWPSHLRPLARRGGLGVQIGLLRRYVGLTPDHWPPPSPRGPS